MMFKSALLALAVTAGLSDALGINCRGSGLCSGNKGALGQLIAQSGPSTPTRPSGMANTLAALTSTILATTQPFTQTFLQQIVDHGCKLCGSVPTDPGNNVANGQLTVNVVLNPTSRDAPQSPAVYKKRSDMAVNDKLPTKRDTPEIPAAYEKRGDNLLVRRLGINCRGSSSCGVGGIGHTPNGDLKDVRDAVAAGEESNFGNGEHIACIPFAFGNLCAFYQGIGSRTFTKEQSVTFLDQLRQHRCSKCGSIPVDPGNDVKNGQLTVNYVA
ncbi:hypothetical protein H9Q73_008521 [Fusarium xylarioides]|nr:hypothetical protein H9Q73_008521 [Fusarium xylarioides]